MDNLGPVIVGGLLTLFNVLLLLLLNSIFREIRDLRVAKHRHKNLFVVVNHRISELREHCGLDHRTIFEPDDEENQRD